MILMTITLFITIAIPICTGMYVYQDAKSRGMEALLWTAIAVFVPYFIGLIIYLVVRYHHNTQKCPRCNAAIKDSYTLCPQCGTELKATCPNCGAYIESNWHLCAHCGTELPYQESYYSAPSTSEVLIPAIIKGLIVSAIIAVILMVLLGLFMGSFFFFPTQIHGINIMHHL